jgi:hypothetical protein
MQSLLAAMALVAVFMFFTVRPLLEANDSRRASRLLAANGVVPQVESSRDDFFSQIEYDPRFPRNYGTSKGEIPRWLMPLAGDLVNYPQDDAIIEVALRGDDQVAAFCQVANRIGNLESLDVFGVSAKGMEQLQKRLPSVPRLLDISVNIDVDIPDGWFASLAQVRSLMVWAERQRMGSPLAVERLREIAELPNLKVLLLFGYSVNDANVQELARSRSLKRIVLRYSDVTEDGKRRLREAMPGCKILGD